MNRRLVLSLIVAPAVLISSWIGFHGLKPTLASSSASAIPAVAAEPAAPAQPDPQAGAALPDVDPRKAFGSKNAPIVMEVFSDFQCPSCKMYYMGTNRQIFDNYVNTGKIYFVHRDFPLAGHAYSKVAARYARAASQIGKFEPVEQALFQNQEKWEQTGDVDGTVAAALSAADMTKVRNLIKGGTMDTLIDKDLALGRFDGVNQTPTTIFHANGQTFPVAGTMNYETLRAFVDQLLAQK